MLYLFSFKAFEGIILEFEMKQRKYSVLRVTLATVYCIIHDRKIQDFIIILRV